MGKKKRMFIDKVVKAARGQKCAVCGDVYKVVRVIKPYNHEETNSIRYTRKSEHVCSCNKAQIFA